jgi:hypothetical protein
MPRERRGIRRINAVGREGPLAVGAHDGAGSVSVHIGQLNLIIAGFRQLSEISAPILPARRASTQTTP